MAKQSNNKLKDILVLIFLVVSIMLVAFQWVEGIRGDQGDANPAFVRATAVDFEIDDSAYENWNQMEPTATPQHRKTHTPELLPTGTPTP